MSAGDFKRLQDWAEKVSSSLHVTTIEHASGHSWTIKAATHVPRVVFTASGIGESADDAAAVVIAQLKEVGDEI